MADPRIAQIAGLIRNIPDFPKPGIQFKDITTLFSDAKGLAATVAVLAEHFKGRDIDYIAGIEARGFMVGAPLAVALGIGFITIRKPGKLPGDKVRQAYELEYGKNELEMHKDSFEKGKRILVIDDLIATGGTLECACQLVEAIGGVVVGCACIAELPELKGRERLHNRELHVLVQLPGA